MPSVRKLIRPRAACTAERALMSADVGPGNSNYESVRQEAEAVVSRIEKVAVPAAAVTVDTDDMRAYCVVTIGGAASSAPNLYFSDGAYLKGLIAEAVCGELVKEVSDAAYAEIGSICGELGAQTVRRLEAPADFPIDRNKVIVFKTAASGIGVRLMKSFTLEPAGSRAFEYVLVRSGGSF